MSARCYRPEVSIHAPRVGSDFGKPISVRSESLFQSTLPAWGATDEDSVSFLRDVVSIHAPRVGSDRSPLYCRRLFPRFQSTLPAWGATFAFNYSFSISQRFNPRSPRGERQGYLSPAMTFGVVSIHAPRVGSDDRSQRVCQVREVSIHAPRVGSDQDIDYYSVGPTVSIHAPRVGSDLRCLLTAGCGLLFQSTLPAWGATKWLQSV